MEDLAGFSDSQKFFFARKEFYRSEVIRQNIRGKNPSRSKFIENVDGLRADDFLVRRARVGNRQQEAERKNPYKGQNRFLLNDKRELDFIPFTARLSSASIR